jgi:hypothetical protein
LTFAISVLSAFFLDGRHETIGEAAALASRRQHAGNECRWPVQTAVSPRDRGVVTGLPCPRCENPKTSLLDATSQLALVNYYGCKRCGLVWHRPKGSSGRVSATTPTMFRKRDNA